MLIYLLFFIKHFLYFCLFIYTQKVDLVQGYSALGKMVSSFLVQCNEKKLAISQHQHLSLRLSALFMIVCFATARSPLISSSRLLSQLNPYQSVVPYKPIAVLVQLAALLQKQNSSDNLSTKYMKQRDMRLSFRTTMLSKRKTFKSFFTINFQQPQSCIAFHPINYLNNKYCLMETKTLILRDFVLAFCFNTV